MNATERDLLTRCPYCEAECDPTDTYCGACGSRILEDVPPVSGGSPAVADYTIATDAGTVIAEVTHTDATAKPKAKRAKKEEKRIATHYMVTMPYSVFALADKTAAKDASRPVLNAVAVVLDKGFVTAADGFQLATLPVQVETAGDEPERRTVIISRDTLLNAKKLAKRGADVELLVSPERYALNVLTKAGMTELPFVPIDGTFPDVQQIIPPADKEHEATICYSPELLAKLCALAIANGNEAIRFTIYGRTLATRIEARDTINPLTAVLMPMVMGGDV